MDRKRLLRLLSLLALAGGLAAALPLAQHWPKEQTVHYVLGDSAPRVRELDARWSGASIAAEPRGGTGGEWNREVTFQYAAGHAPRVVTHQPKMPDGDYTVEMDLVSDSERSTVTKHVTLAGGSTSIELAGSVPR